MNTFWKWVLGILAVVLVIGLFAAPYLMPLFVPSAGYGTGYGMMNGDWPQMPMHNGFGFGGGGMMSMMGGGFGMGFGLFSGLIQLGVLVLIVLAIIWLYNAIKNQNTSRN